MSRFHVPFLQRIRFTRMKSAVSLTLTTSCQNVYEKDGKKT